MLKKCFIIISSLAFTATTGIICPLNTKAIEDIEPVEVVSMRSEYEKHYDNGDGTYTAYIDTMPIHYYENGEWLDIDNTLTQDENGNYVNRNNSMKVTLSPETSISPINTINETFNNDTQMVSIDYNGYSLLWSLIDKTPAYAPPVIKDELVAMSESDTPKDDEEYESITIEGAEGRENSTTDDVKEYPIASISLEETEEVDRDIGMNKLNAKVSESISSLNSSVSYDNIYEATDCKIDIQSNSVKETLILKNPDNILEEYSYYIQSDGLIAELAEDNSVTFFDGEESIFTIPAPFMFDSSENAENNYDISVTLEESSNGYIYTLTPNNDWLIDEARVYPVMIDPYVIPDNTASITCRYNSEKESNTASSGIKLGGISGDAYETYVTIKNNFSKYSNILITDATFFMKMKKTSSVYNKLGYRLYGLTSDERYIFYSSRGGVKDNCAYIKSLEKSTATYDYGWSIDITELANYWLNYERSGDRSKGLPQYGFKIIADIGNNTVEGYDTSATLGSDRPYFCFTYEYADGYRLTPTPSRYNDIDYNNTTYVDNFQDKMNCYAYALQTYYNGSGNYKLHPGEIGLSSTKSSFNNYKELMDEYASYTTTMKSCILCNGTVQDLDKAESTMTKFNNFIKAQMIADADVMGFSIKETNKPLPDDFDEDSERIIAMVTSYRSTFYGSRTDDDNRTVDFHFLLRNGNGTCTNNHGGNCSAWTQKIGLNAIKDSKLCDANIIDNAFSAYDSNFYNCPVGVSFFRITKTNNLYKSSHGNGHFDTSTGTPYKES